MRRRRISAARITEDTLSLKPDIYMFEDLCEGVFTYIDERYRGAFKIEREFALHGDVCICKDAICYFVRLLLNELFGRTLLYVSCGQRIDQTFYLSFSYDASIEISSETAIKLLTYSKFAKTKFECREEGDRMTIYLSMPFEDASFEMVYTPLPYNRFLYALHDIDLPERIDREAVHPDGPLWHLPSDKKK